MRQATRNCLNRKGKNEFWSNEHYKTYKKHNGMHFNSKLAEYASSHMINENGMNHTWTCKDVEGAFASLGLKLPEKSTWGDATYAANMLYSHFAQLLKSDTDAVKMAHALLTDPDGYDGMLFNRYTADIMEKGICVPWMDLI